MTATLLQGDCLELMKSIPNESISAVITDPPYGIDFEYANYNDTESSWYELMSLAVPQMRRLAKMVVLPSCAIKRLPWWYATFPPDWLIAWYKGSPGHLSKIGFNDWEPLVVFGKPPKQMHDYFRTRCGFSNNGHPCPKPIEWARWLVTRCSNPGDTILDPFMGSGTTGVACIQTGRNFVGIEIDPGYFKIAEKRITEAQMQPLLLMEE